MHLPALQCRVETVHASVPVVTDEPISIAFARQMNSKESVLVLSHSSPKSSMSNDSADSP